MEGSPDSILVAVWVTVIVGGVLLLIGGGFYLGSRVDRARAKGRREASEALEMSYDRKGQNLPPSLFECGLFQRGRWGLNAICGGWGDFQSVALFEYQIHGGTTTSRSTVEFTAVAFRLATAFPVPFRLVPKNALTRTAALFDGEETLEIPMDQRFNDAFMAFGPRVDGIQAVLPERLRQGLVAAPKFTVEGSGSWLLFYRSERRNVIDPGRQAAESHLNQVSEIARLFA